MIAKITSGSSAFGIINYNQSKVDNNQANILFTNHMPDSLTPGLIEPPKTRDIIHTLDSYAAGNQNISKPIIHISINPSPKDELSDETAQKLIQDYMQRMGYDSQPYVVYKHQDISRTHYHVVSVNIDRRGNKISDSYQHLNSMRICRQLETAYQLQAVSNEKLEERRLFLNPIDYRKGDLKRQVSGILKVVMQNYKFQSLGEMNALLNLYNIEVKHLKGEDPNNLYNGIIYNILDKNGKVRSKPFKSSSIGQFCGFKAIESKTVKNKESLKRVNLSHRKEVILNLMKRYPKQKDFTNKLKDQHIDVVFRRNAEGRLYGVTFIDHQLQIVYNGSRLGKDFSANRFNDLFDGVDVFPDQNITEETAFNDLSALNMTQEQLDEIFGTFDFDDSPIQSEELLDVPEKKKKIKKKKFKQRRGFRM